MQPERILLFYQEKFPHPGLEVEQDAEKIKLEYFLKRLPMMFSVMTERCTTKPVGQGTGLGLSISRQIVEENHGGSLTCNSVLGGTEFAIAIPID